MQERPVIHVTATQCKPEVESKFNRWLEETHIPMLLKFKGLKGVTRYKTIYETEEYPKYLTIFTFASQKAYEAYETGSELAAAREETKETWKEGGIKVIWRVQYQPIKTWAR